MLLKSTHLRIIYLSVFLISVFIITNGCTDKSQSSEKPSAGKSSVQENSGQDYNDSRIAANDSVSVKYEYQWIDTEDIPPVVIVVDDFGQITGKLLEEFMELDDNITFAILPDLPYTSQTAKMANVYGHEVIIHIPMEAMDKKQNPGANFIHSGQSETEVKEILSSFFKQIPQAIGANNHMGSSATSDYNVMLSVMKNLKAQRLFFLDSKTTSKSMSVNAAKANDIDYAIRDIFLDVPDVSAATINSKLKELEKYKGRIEPVIIISHCHNTAKLEALRSFVTQLNGLGIKLISLSDAIEKFKIHPS